MHAEGVANDTTVTSRTGARLWDAVEARYREEGLWEDLIELCLEKLEETSDPKERAPLFKSIGDAFRDGLDDPDQAFDALLEGVVADPRDGEVVEALEGLARKLGRWQELIQAIGPRVQEEIDAERRIDLLEHLARWLQYELREPELAQTYIAQVRALDPTRAIVQRTMASEFRKRGAFEAERDALERAMIRAATDDERVHLLLTLAALHETRFHDGATAKAKYEAALERRPRCIDALEGLERLARSEENFGELESVLERQVEFASDDALRVRALLRLADLKERTFVRPQQAVPLLETVLRIDPTNAAAVDALERCYHSMRAWKELVSVLERRIALAGTPRAKVDVMLRIAEVLESKLEAADAAFDTCKQACRVDAQDPRPVAELARLSERAGDWVSASTYRAKLADLTPEARAKALIHVGIGQLLAAPERNPKRARTHFERAVVLEPENMTAWEALQGLSEREGDLRSAAFCLEQRATRIEAPRLKSQLYVELASVRRRDGDEDGALEAYRKAIAADATNEAAAEPMLSHHVSAGEWERAAKLCDLLVGAATRDGLADRAFELLRLGARIAIQLGDEEGALSAALAAFKLNERDVAAREELIEICHCMRVEPESISRARAVLDHVAAESFALSLASLAKLADLQRAFGEDERAIRTYDQVIARENEHREALAGKADACVARGAWSEACSCKERLAAAAKTKDEQFALLIESAELWLHGARNPARAVEVFERALTLRPRDHWLLHTLLSVYGQLAAEGPREREVERWEDVARTLRAIVDVEEDAPRKAKSVYAMAQVVRDKIGDRPRAAALFEEVLEFDSTRLDAFERIVRIWTELKDWPALAAAYTRMIGRVPGGSAKLRYALHHQLGLVFRDRVGDPESALAAFSTARALQPDSEQDRRIVTELYVLTDQIDNAIADTRRTLLADAFAPQPYHELYGLFLRQSAYDKAWCVADVLVHLGAANEEQHRFLHDYPPYALPNVPGTLCAAAWATHLSHPELDPTLTAVFALITPAVLRARLASMPARDQRALLGEPIQEPCSRAEHALMCALRDASEILGHPPPVLARKAGAAPLEVALSVSPTLLLSPDAAQGIGPGPIAFLAGKRLAEQRPALLARAMFPSVTELGLILQTAIRIARSAPGSEVPRERGGTLLSSGFDEAIHRAMSKDEVAELRRAVSALFRPGASADLTRWLQLTDLASSRSGLLLAGSVEFAKKGLLLEAQRATDRAPRERIGELLVFAVSDEYSDLRGAIGVSVEATLSGAQR